MTQSKLTYYENRCSGCQSFRLQVDSPTSRSFRLHDQVVSPTQFESFHVHLWVEIFFEDRWKSLLIVNKGFVFDRISSSIPRYYRFWLWRGTKPLIRALSEYSSRVRDGLFRHAHCSVSLIEKIIPMIKYFDLKGQPSFSLFVLRPGSNAALHMSRIEC